MPTQSASQPCDCSSFANFKSWASQISALLSSLGGFVQAADSGQVNWSTSTLAGDILQSGNTSNNGVSNATYPTLWRGLYSAGTTYSIGDVVQSGSNVFVSVANANTGNTPAGGATDTHWKVYCYEIWKSNDALTPFFVKIEYGQIAANVPQISIQIGTATTGTSSLTGNTGQRELLGNTSSTFVNGNSTSAAANTSSFECDFYGAGNGSAFAALMFRNITTNGMSMFFAFERSKNSSGADTSTFVTLLVGGGANSSTGSPWRQHSVFLSSTPAIGTRTLQSVTIVSNASDNPAPGASTGSWQVGNNIPAMPIFPAVGYFANPLLVAQALRNADAVEGGQFTVGMYGSIHTYLMSKANWTASINNTVSGNLGALVMRWE